MADYFTQFSCVLDLGMEDNAARALALYDQLAAELEESDDTQIGFLASITPEGGGAQLWICADESGDPDHVARFVCRCAEAFQLTGRWGFQWAHSCSKPRLDGFGGGALLIDLAAGETVASLDTGDWLDHESTSPAADQEPA